MVRNKKRICEIIATILIAIIIEILFFNFSAVKTIITKPESTLLNMNQLKFMNWDTANQGLVSCTDPMIYADGVDINAITFTIKMNINPLPESLTVFYTTDPVENFSAEKMISVSPVTGENTIQLNDYISAIRVDPGEDAGLLLSDVSFAFNEIDWNISMARIIAILVIYWGTKFLMYLQKTPDYGIAEGNNNVS